MQAVSGSPAPIIENSIRHPTVFSHPVTSKSEVSAADELGKVEKNVTSHEPLC